MKYILIALSVLLLVGCESEQLYTKSELKQKVMGDTIYSINNEHVGCYIVIANDSKKEILTVYQPFDTETLEEMIDRIRSDHYGIKAKVHYQYFKYDAFAK